MNLAGRELSASDLDKLAQCGIPPELARQALLRRVTSAEGAQIVGRNGSGDFAGVAFPYTWPGQDHVRDYRLRRDRPDITYDIEGKPKDRDKYLTPPGRGNMLYFVPGTDAAWLRDPTIPVMVTEGEKKTLALFRLAHHNLGDAGDRPRFLPIGLSGAWSWKGTIGKTTGPDGDRRDVKGPVPDLARITWEGRRVSIVYDVNVQTNSQVRFARVELTRELRRRGAEVCWFAWPSDTPKGVNGIDDLLAAFGPERTLELVHDCQPYRQVAAAERGPVNPPNLLTQGHHDCGNADRLIALYGTDLRYCHAFRKWLAWDGRRWAVDQTGQAEKAAKLTVLEFLRQGVAANDEPGQKFARASLDSRRINGLLSMAECELVVTPNQLDTDPWFLNFHNGTVDLRNGDLQEHNREHLITKVVRFDYDPGADCPLFRRFLQRVLSPSLAAWIQKAIGYSLTGTTREKAVFLCHGTGNNGKTTLLSLFLRLLEEYSVLLQIDSLMVRQESNNSQADLADLRGARFVMTSEVEEGQRIAEGKLKRITQGMGAIKAVRKYENPIQFPESHKLWIDANHKPTVRGTDNAIWNRLKLIPFQVVIPPEEIDPDLPGKLLGEAEGILAWAVAGAVLWFREGLGTPAEIENANRAWRADSDQLGRFVEDCCVIGDCFQVKARYLYNTYKAWTEGAGEHWVCENAFAGRLVERGLRKKHTETAIVYQGIGLKDARES